MRNNKRKTNLQAILRKHGIKQCELAQETEIDGGMISRICNGRKSGITLNTAMRICNAINDFLEVEKMQYTLHDIFYD